MTTISYQNPIISYQKLIFIVVVLWCSISVSFSQTRITFLSIEDSSSIRDLVIQICADATHQRISDIQITDQAGQITLKKSSQDSIFLLTSHLKFAPATFSLQLSTEDTIFYLTPQTFKIKEVTVKAFDKGVRVKGDTIRFDLKVFRNASQKDLRDLLKDLPGIEISEDGTIKYQGKKIDKILISGRDVVRSQFEALNRLLVPQDLASVQVTPGKEEDANGNKGQYLDLILQKDRQLFLSLDAGIAHNLRTEQSATLLSTGEQSLHHFASIARKRLDQPALNSNDALRARDFEFIQLNRKIDPISNTVIPVDKPYVMGPNGRDITAQYNGSYLNDHEVTFYFRGGDRLGHNFRMLTVQNAATGAQIESNQSNSTDMEQNLLGSLKWKYPLSRRIKLMHYLKSEYINQRREAYGFSNFLDNKAQYRQTLATRETNLIFLHSTQYAMTSDWRVTLLWEYILNSNTSPFIARSTQPIFGTYDSNSHSADFAYDLHRQYQRTLFSTSLDYHITGLSYGLKYTATHSRLKEKGKGASGLNSPFGGEYPSRMDYSYHIPRCFVTRKSKQSRYNLEAGIMIYRQDTGHHTVLGSDLFLKGRYQYNFTRLFNLIVTFYQYKSPLPLENLWETPTLLSLRSYQRNTSVEEVYSNTRSGIVLLKYLFPQGGKIFLSSFSITQQSQMMLGLLSTQDGYQITTYSLANNAISYLAKTFVHWSINRSSLDINFDFLRREAQLSHPTPYGKYNYQKITQRIRFNPRLGRKTSLSLGVGVSRIHQSFALTSQEQILTRWSPTVDFRHRITDRWRWKSSYEMVYLRPFPTQHILSGGLDYYILSEHLTASIWIHDLLHFGQAIDYSTQIQSNLTTLRANQRLGGYVLLKMEYRI